MAGIKANPHIESRWKYLKRKYNAVAEMRGSSGFGWDETTKKVQCEKSVYDEWCKIPVVVGASGYEAVSLYTGRRVIDSKGGLLGLGGGFILGPLFLELGIPPQGIGRLTSYTRQEIDEFRDIWADYFTNEYV